MTGLVTGLVAATLLVLAGLDGAFAGFRSSVGRTGLVDHRAADRIAARRGLVVLAVLLAPVLGLVIADVAFRPERAVVYTRAGAAMLAVYLPYGALVLLALAVYGVLPWRWKYLASALILGPFTLVRPYAAVAGGLLGILVTRDPVVAAPVVAAVAAVLAVEPVTDHRWYGLAAVGRLGR